MITVKAQSDREITDAHSKEETLESVSAQNAESLECRTEKERPISTRDETGPIENRSTSCEPKDDDKMVYKSKEISGLVSDETQPSNSVKEQEYASGLPFLSETQRDSHPINLQDRMSAGAPGRRRRCSCHNFRDWIFLEEEVCSCTTRDNRMDIDLLGDYSVIPRNYPGKVSCTRSLSVHILSVGIMKVDQCPK